MKRTLTMFCLLLAMAGMAQPETTHWHFGFKSQLIFSADTVLASNNSEIDVTQACASIADEDGNLLFYTDGITVWNRDHEVMENGEDLGAGPSDWFTSVLVIPDPGDKSRYYIFTNRNGGDFLYSIVDMNMDNGLGGLPPNEKNQYVVPGLLDGKFTAIRHANGTDIWLVFHGLGGSILSFLIKEDGIQDPVITENAYDFWNFVYGPVVASPDGTKIVIAPDDGFDGFEEYLVLIFLDFDAATGMVSNAQKIYEFSESSYSVAFSPDGKRLYRTRFGNTVVYQYDLTADNIGASRTVVSSSPANYGAIQQGPDCRLYIAVNNADYLSVIASPNELGTACDFIEQGVALEGSFSYLGLPNLPPAMFEEVDCNPVISKQEEAESDFNFVIFPNPSSDRLTIESVGTPADSGTIKVYNLQQQEIWSMQSPTAWHQIDLDVSRWPSGVYWLQMSFNQNTHTQKLIIQ